MASHEHQEYSTYIETGNQQSAFYSRIKLNNDDEIRLSDHQAQELVGKAEIHSQNLQSQQLSDQQNLASPSQVSSTTSTNLSMVARSDDMNSSGDDLDLSGDTSKRHSDRQHICMTCFKAFRNKPQLSQHELVHNNMRKHVCSYCDKSFKQICHLNQHMRVHTGERPYKCDVEGCGRSFAQLSNLNHHKKNHEEHVKRDIARQFRCEVCDRSYATKQSLNTHIQKLHTNLKSPEGSITSPIVSPSPVKKRKSVSKDLQASEIQTNLPEIEDAFMLECESINDHDPDDDLPTQVKVKPRFMATKSNLMVRIGTPSGERDRNQGPRTTLPLPFSLNQGSPVSTGQKGQDSFVPSMASVQMSFSQLAYSQSNVIMSPSEQRALRMASEAERKVIQSRLHGKESDGPYLQSDQRLLARHGEGIDERMQKFSDEGFLHSSEHPTHNLYDKLHNLHESRSIENSQLPVSAHMAPNEVPSRVTHHYPKMSNQDHEQRVSDSPHSFSHSFSTNDRQGEYQLNQY
ncbi:transcription factor IIIA-like isoform X1 [Dreissena polymorpha]|uniref:transcription factor IIIA-like isoform X1 n=1 Tax=Dreissena polymorpha TaxID=45954 RepID=UPI002264D58C|nr:transcription factor IIIA-like isoform X1 [Dreissena polymorpha]